MTVQVSAFRWVPPFAQGYVRDLWVRWALEEAERPYQTTLIDPTIQASETYRAWQPFGQVPAFRDGDIELFETGAIVLHIAARAEALAPADEAGRARVASWVFAALNTIDPLVKVLLDLPPDQAATKGHRDTIEMLLNQRLRSLSTWLGDKPFLEGRFTAGDLMMTGVLRELVDSGTLASHPALDALRQRCEGRPAFRRALDAQMRTFRETSPT